MWSFRAMNTDVTVFAPLVDDAAAHAFALATAALFASVEQRFSRFLAHSELATLNHATSSIAVSAEMLDLLRVCRRHVHDTDGLFDPAIGAALCAAGYDRSFTPGALDRDEPIVATHARFFDLEIDEAARVVRRPAHLQLDFGGFLKGRTVDRAAAAAPEVALIDAGGDMILRGAGPDGEGWLVDIEDPGDSQRTIATLRIRDRAVATSAANRRRWRAGRCVAHHLIDPRTSAPSMSDLAQVTVVAPSAERADVSAKVAFLLGAFAGRRFIEARPDLAALFVRRDGSLELVGALELVAGGQVATAEAHG